MGQIDAYRITDILTTHQTPTTPAAAPEHIPDATWEQVIAHATAEACVGIGYTAYTSGKPQARTAWQHAADAGNTHAMFNLGVLLHEQGDTDTARTWYTRATDADDTDAMTALGFLLEEQGDTDTARTWYTRAAQAGHTNAMGALGALLEQQ